MHGARLRDERIAAFIWVLVPEMAHTFTDWSARNILRSMQTGWRLCQLHPLLPSFVSMQQHDSSSAWTGSDNCCKAHLHGYSPMYSLLVYIDCCSFAGLPAQQDRQAIECLKIVSPLSKRV